MYTMVALCMLWIYQRTNATGLSEKSFAYDVIFRQNYKSFHVRWLFILRQFLSLKTHFITLSNGFMRRMFLFHRLVAF